MKATGAIACRTVMMLEVLGWILIEYVEDMTQLSLLWTSEVTSETKIYTLDIYTLILTYYPESMLSIFKVKK